MTGELNHAEAAARHLVEIGDATVVRYAAGRRGAWLTSGMVAGERTASIAARSARSADDPLDWMCASKPVLAYAALRAALDAGLSPDTDLRPFLHVAPCCPPITLRQVLTYRSGLVRRSGPGYVECVSAPPLSRPREWNPDTDAEYWNAGWEVLPSLVERLTDQDFEQYLLGHLLKGQLGMDGVGLRRGMSTAYRSGESIRNSEIRRVITPDDLATSLNGPLIEHCRFLGEMLDELSGERTAGSGGVSAARELVGANPGPDYFARGVSRTLRWAMGFPHRLHDQGLENQVPPDGFGSQGAVLTLTPRGLQYAWVLVAGAVPSLEGTFAVAMDGLRPVPDERYRRMAGALVADVQGAAR